MGLQTSPPLHSHTHHALSIHSLQHTRAHSAANSSSLITSSADATASQLGNQTFLNVHALGCLGGRAASSTHCSYHAGLSAPAALVRALEHLLLSAAQASPAHQGSHRRRGHHHRRRRRAVHQPAHAQQRRAGLRRGARLAAVHLRGRDRHAHRPLLVSLPGQVYLSQRDGPPRDRAGQDVFGPGPHGASRHQRLLHRHGPAGGKAGLAGCVGDARQVPSHADGQLPAVAGRQPDQLCLLPARAAHPLLQRRLHLLGVLPVQHGQQEAGGQQQQQQQQQRPQQHTTLQAGPSTGPEGAVSLRLQGDADGMNECGRIRGRGCWDAAAELRASPSGPVCGVSVCCACANWYSCSSRRRHRQLPVLRQGGTHACSCCRSSHAQPLSSLCVCGLYVCTSI